MNICIPYLDDILIVAKSLPELVERCETVFTRIAEAGLKLNPEKTIIGSRRIKFLGFIVSKDGIEIDDSHIRKVREWDTPKTVKAVRRFYGLANFLRKHVDGFARIAAPLQEQMGGKNEHKIIPTEDFLKSFQELKDALISPPVLAYPDYAPDAQPFRVKPDACQIACGATLTQVQDGEERVIAYASRAFTKSQLRWPISEKESYAIWWAITSEFRHHIEGRKFEVYTDHKPCLAMKRSKLVNERMYRMALSLQQYQFDMFYKSGETHGDADAMSRLPEVLWERVEGNDCPCICSDCEQARKAAPAQTADAQNTPVSGADESTPIIAAMNIEGEIPIYAVDTPTAYRESAATQEYDTSALVDNYATGLANLRRMGYRPTVRQRTQQSDELQILAVSGAGYQPDMVFTAQQEDPETRAFYEYLKNKTLPKHKRKARRIEQQAKKLFLDGKTDIVYHMGGPLGRQLYVPERLRHELLVQFHSHPLSGHVGMYRTFGALNRSYFWPGMRAHVNSYIRTCEPCQQRNTYPKERVRERQQVDVPHIFERVALDFQGPSPATPEGYTHVLNFICLNTGWVEGVPLKPTELDAKFVAQLVVEKIILRWGPPRHILSDKDSKFVNAMIRHLLKIFGINQLTASAYHPQTDGKIERVHRTLNNIIAKLVDPTFKDWRLPYLCALHAYRVTPNSVYGDTPYFLVHGRDCPNAADIALQPETEKFPPVDDISDPKVREWFLKWRAQLVKSLDRARRRNDELQQELQRELVREHRYAGELPREYFVGDRVWVRRPFDVKEPGIPEKYLHKYLPMPHRIVGMKDDAGLSYELRSCTEPNPAKTITRNVDDLKPYWAVAKKGEVAERQEVHVPTPVDNSDLPISGDDHGWNRIASDEFEITRIIDHVIQPQRGGGAPRRKFLVVSKGNTGDTSVWKYESDLRAPDLIAKYVRDHPEINDPKTWQRVLTRRQAAEARGLVDKNAPAAAKAQAAQSQQRKAKKTAARKSVNAITVTNICAICDIVHPSARQWLREEKLAHKHAHK